MSGHLPEPHTWVCTACATEWPCATRRRQLLVEYAGSTVSLGLLMAKALMDAARDLPDLPADALYRRFVGWVGTAEDTTGGPAPSG